MLLRWLLLACATEAPVALPPSLLTDPAQEVVGRMVAVPGVRAWLARPPEPAQPCPGVLVLVEHIDEATRSAASLEAASGKVVLVIGPDSDPEAARRYLDGMARTTELSQRCEAARCQPGAAVAR